MILMVNFSFVSILSENQVVINLIYFSDELSFLFNRFVNRHKCHDWYTTNRNIFRESHTHVLDKINERSEKSNGNIIGLSSN